MFDSHDAESLKGRPLKLSATPGSQMLFFPPHWRVPPIGLFDDFCGPDTPGYSYTSGAIGQLNWFSGGTGTPTVKGSGGVNTVGQVQLVTSSAANDTCYIYLSGDASGSGWLHSDGDFDFVTLIKGFGVDANISVHMGLVKTLNSTEAFSGVYFEKLNTDTNWFAVTEYVVTKTRTDTGVAYGSIMAARARKAGSTVYFSWASTLAGLATATETAVSTNVPVTTRLYPAFFIQTHTTASKFFNVDLFQCALDISR